MWTVNQRFVKVLLGGEEHNALDSGAKPEPIDKPADDCPDP